MVIYPTGMLLIPFSSTPRLDPLRIYLYRPSSTRNFIFVIISGYNCISSRKITDSPSFRGTSEYNASFITCTVYEQCFAACIYPILNLVFVLPFHHAYLPADDIIIHNFAPFCKAIMHHFAPFCKFSTLFHTKESEIIDKVNER